MLELLIVVAIMAVLAAVAIFVLNPAETLRETRDAQRISDLATIKTAIALYITKTTSTISLGTGGNSVGCKGGTFPKINYSVPSDTTSITTVNDGYITSSSQVLAASSSLVNGTGWIPVNLSSLIGGSPISDMPVDPTNTITTGGGSVASTDLVYRYACDYSDSTFEINATLESSSIGAKKTKDGGNNISLYETGTKLTILGSAAAF